MEYYAMDSDFYGKKIKLFFSEENDRNKNVQYILYDVEFIIAC